MSAQPGTVQIDEALAWVLVVNGFSGILFKVQAGHADFLDAAIGQINFDFALTDNRVQEL